MELDVHHRCWTISPQHISRSVAIDSALLWKCLICTAFRLYNCSPSERLLLTFSTMLFSVDLGPCARSIHNFYFPAVLDSGTTGFIIHFFGLFYYLYSRLFWAWERLHSLFLFSGCFCVLVNLNNVGVRAYSALSFVL